MTHPRPRILVLARSYPSDLFPTFGLWTERPARELSRSCELRVISPVPYCPPLPRRGPLIQYTRFRDIVREEVRHGIKVYRPRFFVGPADSTEAFDPIAYELALARLVKRIRKEFPFDLVHAHFIHPDGVVARSLARRYDVPFVVTDHAPWSPALASRLIRRPSLAAGRDAAALVAVSGYVRDTMKQYLPTTPVRVIPNGVDPDEFELGRPEARNPKQIVFVGLVNLNKGIDVLLAAMELVLEREPEAKLLIIGGSYYRKTRLQEEQLRRAATPLIRRGRVEFLGRQPPGEVARHMRESAVLVLPSRAETFGAVLIEALASGTPVVSTRSGGPEDIVTDELGRLVDYGDVEGLAEALLDVLASPSRFPPPKLREHVLARYSLAAITRSYERLFAEILGRSSSDSEPSPVFAGSPR